MASPRNSFLENLATWEYGIPLQTQWIALIQPGNTGVPGETLTNEQFLRNIGAELSIDYPGWRTNDKVKSAVFSSRVNNETLGCYFMQGFSFPEEIVAVNDAGVENMYGYLRGTAGGERQGTADRKIVTVLLETNLDIVDGLIKPWIVSGGYKGLLARPAEESIKATIYMTRYTRGDKSKPRPHTKLYTFYNCMPVGVFAAAELKYTPETEISTKSVEWTYTNYKYELYSF